MFMFKEEVKEFLKEVWIALDEHQYVLPELVSLLQPKGIKDYDFYDEIISYSVFERKESNKFLMILPLDIAQKINFPADENAKNFMDDLLYEPLNKVWKELQLYYRIVDFDFKLKEKYKKENTQAVLALIEKKKFLNLVPQTNGVPAANDYIVQSNALLLAQYDLSVVQKRCIYTMTYKFQKSEFFQNLVGEYVFCMEPYEFGIVNTRLSIVYAALQDLVEKSFIAENSDKRWVASSFLTKVEHDKEEDKYYIFATKDFMQHIDALSRLQNYSLLNVTAALKFSSKYSQRIYEICCRYRNLKGHVFTIEAEFLLSMLGINQNNYTSYKKNHHLRERIFNPAKKEMDELYSKGIMDLTFDYKPAKAAGRGNKICSWMIFVKEINIDKNIVAACPKKEEQVEFIRKYVADFLFFSFANSKQKTTDYQSIINNFIQTINTAEQVRHFLNKTYKKNQAEILAVMNELNNNQTSILDFN